MNFGFALAGIVTLFLHLPYTQGAHDPLVFGQMVRDLPLYRHANQYKLEEHLTFQTARIRLLEAHSKELSEMSHAEQIGLHQSINMQALEEVNEWRKVRGFQPYSIE